MHMDGGKITSAATVNLISLVIIHRCANILHSTNNIYVVHLYLLFFAKSKSTMTTFQVFVAIQMRIAGMFHMGRK